MENKRKEELFECGHMIYCDKKQLCIEGEDGIFVENVYETKITIYNKSKESIQITGIKENYKFLVDVDPKEEIKKGKSRDFTIKITPLCSCHVATVALMAIPNSGNGFSLNIPLEYTCNLSYHLDPMKIREDEIKERTTDWIIAKGRYYEEAVLIKKLKKQTDEELIKKIKQQAQLLEKIYCPNIVKLVGYVVVPGERSLVLEYSGETLYYYLNKFHVLYFNENDKLKICYDIARAVQYLHQNNILHRDIKPENIVIVEKENHVVTAKLMGLNYSKIVKTIQPQRNTFAVGTPKYLAPEILNQKEYGSAVDIYSLSIVYFEIGKWGEMFENQYFKQQWDIVNFTVSEKRMDKPNNMPMWLYVIICKMWVLEPENRISAPEVVELLQLCKAN